MSKDNHLIARVFPRKTAATPDDDLVFLGPPPLLTLPEIDEVHVSVTFTYDKAKAEELAEDWRCGGFPERKGPPGNFAYRVACTVCRMNTGGCKTQKEADKNWNTRAPILTPEQIKRLEEME